MSFMQVRGGTRGGKDLFQWDEVKVDKHRENYLGHSLMAPVGRWQKGKDLSWYSKESKVLGQKEILKQERAAVKRAEEEAMAAALGLKPKTVVSGGVSKQELAEVCRRQSVEEKEEEGQEERMKGLGYMGHRLSHRHSNQGSATGAAMFESNPVHKGESGVVVEGEQHHRPSPSSSSGLTSSAAPASKKKDVRVDKTVMKKLIEQLGKDKKKKKKKERSRKKHKKDRSRRRHDSSSSDSDTGEPSHNKRLSDSESEEDDRRRRKKKARHSPRSDSKDEERAERSSKGKKRRHDGGGRKRRDSSSESDSQRRKKRGHGGSEKRHRQTTSSSQTCN